MSESSPFEFNDHADADPFHSVEHHDHDHEHDHDDHVEELDAHANSNVDKHVEDSHAHVEGKASPPEDFFSAVDSSVANASANADLFGINQDDKSNALPDIEDINSPYAIWEKERAQILSERAAKASETKRELLAQAKEDLNKFYADLDGRIKKTQQQNRIDEKNYKAELTALMANGTKWEKAAKFTNLNSRLVDKPGGVSRVDRLRKLLISLKAQRDPLEQKS